MLDYEKLSPEEQDKYDEARMTHGQRYQAERDWREFQYYIIYSIIVLVFAVTMLEPLLG